MKKIFELIESSINVFNSGDKSGIHPIKILLFLLEKMSKGDYYGTVRIKINGSKISNPSEDEVKHRLEEKYNDDI